MHTKRMLYRGLAAAGLAIACLAAVASPAQAAEQPTYKIISYVIDDPALNKQPGKIAAELKSAGNLDRLGVKPAVNGKPSAIAGKASTLADEPISYVTDSSAFPGGAKPDDPYRYATYAECIANLSTSSLDAGWIKNRYSFCQTHTISAVAIRCILFRCSVTGVFVSLDTLVGRGKIGAFPGTTGWRWAEFTDHVQVVTATGPFDSGSARMRATLECSGNWQSGGPDASEDACHAGDDGGVRKSIAAWVVDPNATFDLVSEAKTPDAAEGEQIATGVFHLNYNFDLPFPYIFDTSANGPEGGMRFDSAWYVAQAAADGLGSVFDRSVPAFSYTLSDAPVRGVAEHLLQAQADPANTLPPRADKHLAGATASDPLRRLAQNKGQYQANRRAENDRVRTNYCNTVAFRATMPTDGRPYDCDEYPFGSTYEGAGRNNAGYDGPDYDNMYSVRWVFNEENQEAGRRLGRWYENDRLIDEDKFWVPIYLTPPGA